MKRDIIDVPTVRRVRGELAELARVHPELTQPEARARLATWLDEETMAKDAKDERLTEVLYIRVAPEDIARLDALAERLPIASRNAIARAAMRLGLTAIEENPATLVASPLPKRGGKRR